MPETAALRKRTHRGWPIAMGLSLLAAPGCSVFRYAKLVSIDEPKLFCERRDDVASMATYRSWADAAWIEQGVVCPEDCLGGDYSWGFREGFAEYVYAGGSGQPPALPPRPYWQIDMRTPEGARAVESWFAGYRHGARLARDGGFRDRVTLSISASLADCDACGCPDESPSPTLLEPAAPTEAIEELVEPVPDDDPNELILPSLSDPEPTPEELPTMRFSSPQASIALPSAVKADVNVPLAPPKDSRIMPGSAPGTPVFQITR